MRLANARMSSRHPPCLSTAGGVSGSQDWPTLRTIIDYEIEYQKTAHNAGEDCGCELKLRRARSSESCLAIYVAICCFSLSPPAASGRRRHRSAAAISERRQVSGFAGTSRARHRLARTGEGRRTTSPRSSSRSG